MTDIQAAIGREQLKRLPEILVRRRELGHEYRKALEDVSSVGLPFEPAWARSNWQSFCVRLATEEERTQMMQRLLERGIATRRGIACAHREPSYKIQPWRPAGPLYQSEQAQDTGVILPLYPQMDFKDQVTVVSEVKRVLAQECVC